MRAAGKAQSRLSCDGEAHSDTPFLRISYAFTRAQPEGACITYACTQKPTVLVSINTAQCNAVRTINEQQVTAVQILAGR